MIESDVYRSFALELTMISDVSGDFDSLSSEARLPSLLALRCFESAGRFENFARAADELHLTPGAISPGGAPA